MTHHMILGGHRPARLSLLSRLRAVMATRRQRKRLAQLDDDALRDIGVIRAEADRESGRPFWDVPDHWTR